MKGSTLGEIRKAHYVYRKISGDSSPILQDAELFITDTDGPPSMVMAAIYGDSWKNKLAEYTIRLVQLCKREALWGNE